MLLLRIKESEIRIVFQEREQIIAIRQQVGSANQAVHQRITDSKWRQMLFSRSCQYGIQAILYIAKNSDQPYVSIRRIADANEISFHFLSKILQKLTQKDILNSFKGPKGGVCLAKSADTINLLDIVAAIDGLDSFDKCIIGLPNCNTEDPCVLHHQWKENSIRIKKMLGDMTVAQLLKKGS